MHVVHDISIQAWSVVGRLNCGGVPNCNFLLGKYVYNLRLKLKLGGDVLLYLRGCHRHMSTHADSMLCTGQGDAHVLALRPCVYKTTDKV